MNTHNIIKSVSSLGLGKTLRVIGFSTLAALLVQCSDSKKPEPQSHTETPSYALSGIDVDTLQLENPFEGVDDRQMSNFHKPWLEPKRSRNRFCPILIPGKDGKTEKNRDEITPKKITSKKENQNTWDKTTQTMTIFFPFSKADLGENDWRDLAALVKHYRATGASLKRIRIKGHCDTVGGDANNDIISRRRVDAVMAELIRQGINPQEVHIEFEAVGKREATTPDNTKAAEERRVEVTVTDAITESVAQLNPKPDVILIDNSASMLPNLEVLHNYLKRGGNPDTAFYGFDLVNISGNDAIQHNKKMLTVAEGQTPLHEAVNGLASYVVNQRRTLNHKPVIAIVTDGGANGYEGVFVDTTNAIYHLVQVPGYRTDFPLENAVKGSGGKIVQTTK